jgi:hypothetical protein
MGHVKFFVGERDSFQAVYWGEKGGRREGGLREEEENGGRREEKENEGRKEEGGRRKEEGRRRKGGREGERKKLTPSEQTKEIASTFQNEIPTPIPERGIFCKFFSRARHAVEFLGGVSE